MLLKKIQANSIAKTAAMGAIQKMGSFIVRVPVVDLPIIDDFYEW
jgi:hypothetical protein